MNVWMDGWIDECVKGWMERWIKGRMVYENKMNKRFIKIRGWVATKMDKKCQQNKSKIFEKIQKDVFHKH